VSEPGLFDDVLARGAVREAVSDQAWLLAMLDTECALARAQAKVGLIADHEASAIANACRPERIDLAKLARQTGKHASPVVPLVAMLREHAGSSVHFGATSQDILDTATMLVVRRALEPLLVDLVGAGKAAADLARLYRAAPMAGRTLLRQAAPITFGLKAAHWLNALGEAIERLRQVNRERLAVQLGGPVGTLDAYGDKAFVLVVAFGGELGLAVPVLPWHTDRTRIADIAGALGTAAGTVGKIARDITLLAQDEVAEVAEAAPGGSSAMPHKRNPVAAVSALACASQAPGLVATLLASMVQEHERAAGAWQAEWRPLRELLVSVGSAASWLRVCLSGLSVQPMKLRAHLRHLMKESGLETPGQATELVDRALAAWEAQ
jgi:3-carboxy-cis,cis-muconate cycloisomerase